MAQLSGESSGGRNSLRQDDRGVALHSKHKIFLSHSGGQKDFVEQLCVDLERCDRYPFFDKRRDCLPIGENFPRHIFAAIRQCHVGVVILSEEFFTRSKWPMIELVAMVEEAKERRLSFKIVPVFLSISLDQFRDETKRNEWLSCWEDLALKDKRVEAEQWKDALDYLHPINSLVYDGLGEVKFRKVIVDELCKVVRAEIRLSDSHIQGRSRLCKLIQEEINAQQKGENHKVRVLGLYGMGGIGKTSICKALCNEFCSEFHGRVCHAELERGSKEELMREVLKRVTDTSHERINGWREGELVSRLNGGIVKEAVFLAVDNVSDTQASVDEARSYLSASLPAGSVVVVTARGKGTLMRVRPHVTESNVMGMPELDVEEAKSLFAASSNFESRSEADEELVLRCVRRCRFGKDDGNGSKQYHPLTLDVLGKQLGGVDRGEWKAELDKIDEDIFNRTGEAEHPIFSILRKSYDTLSSDDQLLFVDVALGFNPGFEYVHVPTLLEWLGVVHGLNADHGVMKRLERLKRKSLLERIGDASKVRIGMHDLWRAFCKAEVESGELRRRRWVYGAKGSELVDTRPCGGCWENVKRMALGGSKWSHTLERVKFAHFSNVTVLKMTDLDMRKEVVLDLSGLIHLKSLEVEGWGLRLLDLQGLPRCLLFLRWSSRDYTSSWSRSPQFVKEVGFLRELQYLVLREYSGGELPDLSRLTSLRGAIFYGCVNVKTLSGLSSQLSNLRVLDLGECVRLLSCPGLGDLVGLEALSCWLCKRLKRLPNLGRLRNLRTLDVRRCPLISEIPGVGDLGALEELRVGSYLGDSHIFHLPDMRKLRKLRVLGLRGRRLKGLAGVESLVSLLELEVDLREVAERPSLRQLTKLQRLEIRGWSLEGLEDLGNLAMLRTLEIRDCSGVDKLPGIGNLINLQSLTIATCEFRDVSGVSGLSALETLVIMHCEELGRLPDLERLPRLNFLTIWGCPMLRSWNRAIEGQVEVSPCRLDGTKGGCEVASSRRLTGLRSLNVLDCRNLEDVTGIGALSQLETLHFESLTVKEFPDLSNFPRLKTLLLRGCTSLRRLTSREPIHALSILSVSGCSSLTTVPDLSYFPCLSWIELSRCEGIATLSSVGPLTTLWLLRLECCISLNAVPDLGMFPALEKVSLKGCSGLTTLSSSGPLPALEELDARGCDSLNAVLDLGMFPALKRLLLEGCSALTTLSSSGPLLALKKLDARGCDSLSGDALEQLRALCPQCKIMCGALESDVGKKWRRRAVGAGAKILWLGRNIWTCGWSCACEH